MFIDRETAGIANVHWLLRSTETPHGDNDPKDQPAPGLDNNPGKDGRLFSDTHPYVTNAYEGAKEAVKTFLTERFI
jgi:hypothetical protein